MIKFFYPKFWQKRIILSYVLWPLSKIYLFISYIRKSLSRTHTMPAPVICIGNITIGGAGKTQLVIWLAKLFTSYNINFVIITKGYGSNLTKPKLVSTHDRSCNVGDESLLLAKYGQVIAAKKTFDAKNLIQSLNVNVIIVDDGLQNPSFKKDFSVCVIDGMRGFGNEFLIPAGPLRQFPNRKSMHEINTCVIIGKSTIKLNQQINALNRPIFYATTESSNKLDKTKKYFAFCGIGNPKKFYNTLIENELNVISYKSFPDHHNYSDDDCLYLSTQAANLNAALITTSKDYVKLYDILPSVICFNTELKIQNSESLKQLIYEKIFHDN